MPIGFSALEAIKSGTRVTDTGFDVVGLCLRASALMRAFQQWPSGGAMAGIGEVNKNPAKSIRYKLSVQNCTISD
jgi:hypothetical protein